MLCLHHHITSPTIVRLGTHAVDDDVVLFLGSRTANSQLISLPPGLLNKQAASPDAQLHPHSSLQPSAAVTVQRPAMIDNAAPIHDAFVFQEPKGNTAPY